MALKPILIPENDLLFSALVNSTTLAGNLTHDVDLHVGSERDNLPPAGEIFPARSLPREHSSVILYFEFIRLPLCVSWSKHHNAC